MAYQQGDVLTPLAKRGQMHLYQIDAIKKVLAKGMLLHHQRKVGIGGTHHPHIHPVGTRVAKRLKGLFLQHTQHLHL